jgi:hypothetical protein
MAMWKFLPIAYKAYRRLPAAQRRQMMQQAGKAARTHGPTIAKAVGAALAKQSKRPRP